jgi:hypothetical protein
MTDCEEEMVVSISHIRRMVQRGQGTRPRLHSPEVAGFNYKLRLQSSKAFVISLLTATMTVEEVDPLGFLIFYHHTYTTHTCTHTFLKA